MANKSGDGASSLNEFNETTALELVSARDDFQVAQLAPGTVPPPASQTPQLQVVIVKPGADDKIFLPMSTSLENLVVDGDNIVLAQPDGTRVVIEGGALDIPTFVIGNVEIPQEALIAAFESKGIDVAAGPEGLSVVSSPTSSGGNFGEPASGIGDAGSPIDLLPPTSLDFAAVQVVDLAGNAVRVDVTDPPDDVPSVTDTVVSRTVDEGDIDSKFSRGTTPDDDVYGDGSYTGSANYSAPFGGPAYVFGSAGSLVSFGADGAGGFSISPDAVAAFGALNLTSKGTEPSYSISEIVVSGTTWAVFSAKIGNDPVFEFRVDKSDGDFEFRLYDQLDHEAVAGKNFDLVGGSSTLDFGSIIRATDSDGDYVDLDGRITIEIRDDIPQWVAGKSSTGVVEEEQLPGGNEDTNSASPGLDADTADQAGNTSTLASGTLAALIASKAHAPGLSVGADDGGEFTFREGVTSVTTTSGAAVTSAGIAVTVASISEAADAGGVYRVLTAKAGAEEVFSLKVYENGAWSFELEGRLDHLPGDEGGLALDLSKLMKFTDFDGDAIDLAAGSFTVNVIDEQGGGNDTFAFPAGYEEIWRSFDSASMLDHDIAGPLDGARLGPQAADDQFIFETSALANIDVRDLILESQGDDGIDLADIFGGFQAEASTLATNEASPSSDHKDGFGIGADTASFAMLTVNAGIEILYKEDHSAGSST